MIDFPTTRPMTGAERRGIRRHALISRALHQSGTRVVVVQAPAGHGKSTLLEQLRVECEQRGDVTGWLDLGEGDNDIRRFYGHLKDLIVAMKAQGEHAADRATRSADESEFRSDWLLSQLRSIGRPASLFLDDAHLVGARPTLTLLEQIVSRLPQHVQIFIAGRTLPDIGLARLTVAGQAQIIRAQELCFTRDETARYFASIADLELSEPELDQIYLQTDGWPAALQLFRLALRHPLLRRDLQRFGECPPEELASYLAEHVLHQQNVSTREFLLLSATISRVSGDLCDAVLCREDSASQLAQLESAGLFLRRLDREPQWFTYHPLFASFLVDQLRKRGNGQIVELRRRAADWFAAHDRIEDALEHYLAAGDQGAAADALERWSDRLIPLGQLMTVERWSERLSLAEIERRPGLLVQIAWALGFLRRQSRLAPLLETLRRLPALARTDHHADPRLLLTMAAFLEDNLQTGDSLLSRVDVSQDAEAGSFRAFELGAVCNVRGYTAMASGDFPAAHQFFARARHFCGPSGTSFTWAYCVSLNSFALIQQGQLHEALSLLRSSMLDHRMVEDESIPQASVVAAYVTALYEADQLEEARTQFQRFGDVIASTALPDYLVVAFIAMSRVHDAGGEPGKALECLDEAEAIAYAQRWPRLGTIVGWERVRRELVRGEFDRATALAERVERLGDFSTGSGVQFSEDVHGLTIGRLRLHAMLRDPTEALRMITTALGAARRKGRVHRQIKLLQFAAVAHHRRDSASRSQQYLDEALRLAAAGGYLRAFLEEGPLFERAMQDNLIGVRSLSGESPQSRTPQDAFLSQIVHRLKKSGESPGMGAGLGEVRRVSSVRSVERFTRREQTLLKLLAAMVSTTEMAQAMHLSTDGLKFHLKNIYAKLGVRTRMQAVRAARDLELARD
ncbi:LuxR family maltose regulon positive regulatory protein [Panacagrimonas perspica]|uniref:LuxR family maltose regulon positive regulatory protein n=2 Tax=Panacagrimonas perspica TaxID=381431 RepID=A0A4R7NXL0_9GAMM|nr:LuxR family maltose regulon positive regulatory protein [Panacagrimonas perspica]